jgi:hypothetical protein
MGKTLTWLAATMKYGIDRHIWDVPSALWPMGGKVGRLGSVVSRWFLTDTPQLAWIVIQLFLVSTAMTKLSVLMFYRRLVVGTCSRLFKWAIWVAMGIIFASTIIWVVLLYYTCTPYQAYWRQYDVTYDTTFTCKSADLLVLTSRLVGSTSVITDFYSVLLPAILLMRIQISRKQRIGLMFIFGLGFLYVPLLPYVDFLMRMLTAKVLPVLESYEPSTWSRPKRKNSTSPITASTCTRPALRNAI